METIQPATNYSQFYSYNNHISSAANNQYGTQFNPAISNWLYKSYLDKISNHQNIIEEIYSPYHHNYIKYQKNSNLNSKNFGNEVKTEKSDLNEKKEYLNLDTSTKNSLYNYKKSNNPVNNMEYKSDLLVQTEIKYENDTGFYNPNSYIKYDNNLTYNRSDFIKPENNLTIEKESIIPQDYEYYPTNYYSTYIIPPPNQFSGYGHIEESYFQPTTSAILPENRLNDLYEQDLRKNPTLIPSYNQENIPVINQQLYEQKLSNQSPGEIKEEIYSQQLSSVNNFQQSQSIYPPFVQNSTNCTSNPSPSVNKVSPETPSQLQSFESLKSKIGSRQTKKIHQCKPCDKSFSSAKMLNKHLLSSTHNNSTFIDDKSAILSKPQENLIAVKNVKRKRNSTEMISDESLNESNEIENVQGNNQNSYQSSESTNKNDSKGSIMLSQNEIKVNNENYIQALHPLQYNSETSAWTPYHQVAAQNNILHPIANNNQFLYNTNYQTYYNQPVFNTVYNASPYNVNSPQQYSDNSTSPLNFINSYNQNSPPTTETNEKNVKIISNQVIPSFSVETNFNNIQQEQQQQPLQLQQQQQQINGISSSSSIETGQVELHNLPQVNSNNILYYLTTSTSTASTPESMLNGNQNRPIQSSPVTTSVVNDSSPSMKSPVNQNLKNKKLKQKQPTVKKRRIDSTENDNSQKAECKECNRVFSKMCYLTQHNKILHSGETPFKCMKCGKRFHTEQEHNVHVQKHEQVDKPFKCDLCTRQFHHKSDLNRHRESHTGYHAHVCNLCSKGFSRRDHLKQHYETHFSGKARGHRKNKVDQATIARYDETITMVCKEQIK